MDILLHTFLPRKGMCEKGMCCIFWKKSRFELVLSNSGLRWTIETWRDEAKTEIILGSGTADCWFQPAINFLGRMKNYWDGHVLLLNGMLQLFYLWMVVLDVKMTWDFLHLAGGCFRISGISFENVLRSCSASSVKLQIGRYRTQNLI